MKKFRTILLAVVIGFVYSCSKSDTVEPMQLQDRPHLKDTTINNRIPRIPLRN